MAADPLNSLGGFSVGIPAVQVVQANGSVTTSYANIATISGNTATFISNVTAPDFYGTFHGNITGNFVLSVDDKRVLFAKTLGNGDQAEAVGSPNITFDYDANVLTIIGDIVTDSVTMGSGLNEFSTQRVTFATTASVSPNQVLHNTVANTVCSIDYTVIATDATSNTRQTSKLFASILGDEVGYFEYGTIDINGGVGDLRVTYDSGNVLLTVTPFTSNSTTYKIMVTSYKE
jgi:hypothetical protein